MFFSEAAPGTCPDDTLGRTFEVYFSARIDSLLFLMIFVVSRRGEENCLFWLRPLIASKGAQREVWGGTWGGFGRYFWRMFWRVKVVPPHQCSRARNNTLTFSVAHFQAWFPPKCGSHPFFHRHRRWHQLPGVESPTKMFSRT